MPTDISQGAAFPLGSRLAMAMVALLVLGYAMAAFIVRPSLYSDSGWGFLIADSMKQGAPFNNLREPDPRDISKDVDRFIAAWSPGQYMLPGIFEWLGLDLGQAMVAVTTLFSALGLIGWYQLYRTWRFPTSTSVLAIVAIAGTRMFSLPFGIYNGGEVLLFGALPWFVIIVWKARDGRWWQPLLVFLAMTALVFAKLSGIVVAFCCLAAATLKYVWPPGNFDVRRIGTNAAIVLSFVILFYVLWYSRGWTAASDAGVFLAERIFTHSIGSIGATFTAMFSLGDLAARLLQYPGHAVVASLDWFYVLAAAPAIAIYLAIWRQLRRSHPEYLQFAFATACAFVVIMTVIFARGGAIKLEDRFFRPIALILLIGVVHTAINWKKASALLVGVVIAAATAYGTASYVVHILHNLERPLGDRGFRHGVASREALTFITAEMARERPGTRPVLLVTSPEIGLDFSRLRILPTHADFESADQLRARTYQGRADGLIVLIQTRLVENGKAEIILRSFVDYPRSGWIATPLGSFTSFRQ